MRRPLDGCWSIELAGAWDRGRTRNGVTVWQSRGRSMRVLENGFRCLIRGDPVGAVEAMLPPGQVGKVGEPGSGGIDNRTAWLYRRRKGSRDTLYGYNFRGVGFLETVFVSTDTDDLDWAYTAWRSVRYDDMAT